MRSRLPAELEQKLMSAPVPQSSRPEVVDVDVQIPLEVPADRGAVLLYEREEPEDSPSGMVIAFSNSRNMAACRRRRSSTPIAA